MLKLVRKIKNTLAYLINERCTVVNNEGEEVNELVRARIIETKCLSVALGLVFGTGFVLAITSASIVVAATWFTTVFSLSMFIILAGRQIANDAIAETNKA